MEEGSEGGPIRRAMKEETIKGKKILVVGLGKSGMAACRVLSQCGARVYAQDAASRRDTGADKLRFLQEHGITAYLGRDPEDIGSFDMVVLSPAVPPNLPFVEQAREAGAEITGELELAYRLCPGRFVAITGTNGKTTTTSLVGEIYKQAGLKHFVVGNIGVAALDKALEADEETTMVTEVSSFQLETIDRFQPEVSAILNITPDHLNRHGTMEGYKAAKARIFENQTEDQYVIMNFDDKESFALAKSAKAIIVPFSRKEHLMFGAFVKNDRLVIRNHEEKLIDLCGVDELKIPGTHNLENALAAAAICYFAGVAPQAIRAGLIAFPGVAHRIEDCGEIDGVRYFNDSKGTNPDAAIKAVEAMDGPVILIAGGYDKDAVFDQLVASFGGKVRKVILMGATAAKIKLTAERMGYTHTIIMKDMEDCVREAARLAVPGDCVLLSPACASWDMYDNFEQRGDHFKDCVERLRTAWRK